MLRVPSAGVGRAAGSASPTPSRSSSSSYTHVEHTDIVCMETYKEMRDHAQQPPRPPSVQSMTISRRTRTSTCESSPLSEEECRLALMFRDSGDSKRSVIPLLFFLAASLGKLILGFGVALAIRGHYADSKTSFIVGVVLAVLGFAAVVAAALGFGAAVSRISKKWGIIFKAFSITGGVLIAIGYAINQYFVSDERPLFTIRLSFIPLALGTACMGISLPNFTAFTELYRGRLVGLPLRYRPLAALLMLSPSMGSLFGGWVSSEHGHWPIAFNAVVLTFVVALGYGGVSIFWSEQLRLKASLLEMRLCREEEEAQRAIDEKAPVPLVRRATQDSETTTTIATSPTLLGSSANTDKLPIAPAV